MKRLHFLTAAGLAALLAACDQVRLPGVDAPARSVQVAEEAPTPDAGDAATGAVDTPAPDTGGETPTVDRDAPAPGTPVDPTPGETAGPALPAPALAAFNAARCGAVAGLAPTPTVGMVAGATTREEPLIGTEAVNALSATLSAFPGIVKLEPRRSEAGGVASGHCGAVRVRANWFVTAAHCVDQPYDEYRLIGDAANLRSPEARITAAETAICHGGYLGTDNSYANDIALLRLSSEQAAAIPNVPIARLGATALALAPVNYPTAEMAGWGLTRFGGQLSNDLLTTQIRLSAVGPAAITVTSQGGAGPCIGDSGGPLYVTEADGTRTVIGVLSVVEQNRATGQFCFGEYNGRYTNLQGYSGWIDSVIALCDAQPDACK